MADPFFDRPILNSPYEYPKRHWDLDAEGQPAQQIIEDWRRADFITPIPPSEKRTGRQIISRSCILLEVDRWTKLLKGKSSCRLDNEYDSFMIRVASGF